jgi:hypothetical protein
MAERLGLIISREQLEPWSVPVTTRMADEDGETMDAYPTCDGRYVEWLSGGVAA